MNEAYDKRKNTFDFQNGCPIHAFYCEDEEDNYKLGDKRYC